MSSITRWTSITSHSQENKYLPPSKEGPKYALVFKKSQNSICSNEWEFYKGNKKKTIHLATPNQMIKAVEEGDIKKIADFISSGSNVNVRHPDGRSLLMIAISKNLPIKEIDRLIEAGAKVEGPQDKEGCTPLILAVKSGHSQVVKKLLTMNVDINAQDIEGNTALMWSVRNKNPELVGFLTFSGADVQILNKEPCSPLHYALLTDQSEVIMRLADFGLNYIQVLCADSASVPIMQAISERNIEDIKKLATSGEDLNFRNEHGITPLSLAISLDLPISIIKLLMDSGAKIGPEHMEFAIVAQNLEVVKELGKRGADLFRISQQDGTALMLAIKLGDLEFVGKIFERSVLLSQADIKSYLLASNQRRATALTYAIKGGQLEIVKLFLGSGFTGNPRNPYSILDVLKMHRPENYRKMLSLITEKAPALKIRHKEVKYRKQLAHVWNMDGMTEIDINIKLEGGFPSLWFNQMRKNLGSFALLYPDEAENLEMLENAFAFAADQNAFSNSKILTHIKNGFVTFLDASNHNHTATLCIWGDQLVICNRGIDSRRHLEIYHFNQDSLTEEIIDKIRKLKVTGSANKYIKLILNELPDLLKFSQTEIDKQLEKSVDLQGQIVPNCSWFSPITAFYAMLLLRKVRGEKEGKLLDNSRLAKEIPSLIKDHVEKQYRRWLAFEHIASLEQILKLIPAKGQQSISPYPPDHKLIQKVLEEAHLLSFDEILTNKLNVLTHFYIESLENDEAKVLSKNVELWKQKREQNLKELVL